MIMGRVTYIHHYVSPPASLSQISLTPLVSQLPTLYFSVLMFSHLTDHFIFTSRRLSDRTKQIVFGVISFIIVATFWWFRGVAWGIDGPINEHWGLKWRSVRPSPAHSLVACADLFRDRTGTYIMSNYRIRSPALEPVSIVSSRNGQCEICIPRSLFCGKGYIYNEFPGHTDT